MRVAWIHAAAASAGLLLAGLSGPAGASPFPLDARILEEGPQGFRVEIRVPLPAVEEVLLDGRAYTRLRIPGFVGRTDPGLPDVLMRGIPFAVPAGAEVTTQVEVLETESFRAAPPLPAPRPYLDGELEIPQPAEAYEPDPAAYGSGILYPAELVSVGPEHGWRFHRVRTLNLSPIQVEPANGVYRVARALRVTVRFVDAGRKPAESGWVRMAADRPEWETKADGMLVNARSARQFRTRPLPAPAVFGAAQSETNIRIRIGGTGLARIRFEDLAAAGLPEGLPLADVAVEERDFDANAADPFVRRAVPRRIEDADGNGTFGPGDRVVFYAFDFAERFQPNFVDGRYTHFHAYWVASGPGAGRDFAVRPGVPTAEDPVSVTSFPHRMRLEEEKYYINFPPDFQVIFYPSETTLYWVGPGFQQSDSAFAHTFATPDFDPAGSVRFEPVWQGAFPDGVWSTHNVTFAVNGTMLLSNGVFPGLQTFRWTSPAVSSATLLRSPSNTFRITGYGRNGIAGSGAYFDRVDVTYDRLLRARDNRLVFNTGDARGTLEFEIPGFGSSDVLLLDITDRAAPERVEGSVEAVGDGTFRLRFQDEVNQRRTYFAGTASSFDGLPPSPRALPPDLNHDAAIAAGSGGNLLAEGENSDYILVTHPRFREGFAELVEHREEQGHRVLLCDTDELYDQFSGGDKSPAALKRFLNRAFRDWDDPPTFLLLGGDANEDYRSDTGTATPDWVPTMMHEAAVPGAKKIRELAGTDTWYVSSASPGDRDLDAVPDMYVGRLPVGSAEEARAAVEKIRDYESMDPGDDWRNRGVLFADDQYSQGLTVANSYCWKSEERTFLLTSEEVREGIEEMGGLTSFNVIPFYLAAHLDTVEALKRNPGPGDCPQADDPFDNILTITSLWTRANVTPKLIQELTRGCLFWAYAGHANAFLISSESTIRHRNRSDRDLDKILNLGKPFIFHGYACHLNEFEYSEQAESGRSIGENLLLAPGRGAIASFASTGYEWLHTNREAQVSTMAPLFWDVPRDPRTGRPRRLLAEAMQGGLIDAAMRAGFTADYLNMLRTYLVLGDPALRIDLSQPEFRAEVNGEAFPEGGGLTAASLADSVAIQVLVSDDVDVAGLRVFDGSVRLDSTRVLVTPPDPGQGGLQVYRVDFKTVLRLEDYSVRVEAEDWDGRASALEFPVRYTVGFSADGIPLTPGGENLVDRTSTLAATVEAPVPLTEESIQILVDGVPVPADAAPLDESGRRWAVAVSGPWSGGPHTLALVSTLGDQSTARETAFAVPTDRVELDAVYFYPNPYESGRGSLSYRLTNSAEAVGVAVYTVKGRRVLEAEGPARPGWNAIGWDGTDEEGDPVANGVYLMVLNVRAEGGRTIRHLERVAVTR